MNSMEDKLIMQNLLDCTKSLCNLLNQSSVEANETSLSNDFKNVLGVFLNVQHETYKAMQEEGWYPVEQVKAPAINKVKTKFASA